MWSHQTKENFEVGFEENYINGLLSWKDIEIFINTRPLITTERFSTFEHVESEWFNDSWATENNTFPPSLVRDIIENNGVCVLVDTSKFCKSLNDFAHELETTYGRPTDSHIYMCRNIEKSHPFGIHFDYNHNVIVQCEGETNFKVWDIVKDKYANNYRMQIDDKPILDVIMRPGDAIWIPAYYPHVALSQSKRMSVSFPISVDDRKEEETFIQEREWITL